ncbi:MAG: SPFH domain-containing protein [Elusimicrobiota bacterium]
MIAPGLIAAVAVFVGCFIAVPVALGILQALGVYTIVRERESKVFMLFGKVVGKIDEPGLHFLWEELGWKALIVNPLGSVRVVDMRLDQQYLRSRPVNSEEGAPMGIGAWYEMFVSDPVPFLFRNTDPRGSLSSNVTSTVVRCLSNMPLDQMLEDRHHMSQTVRSEVSPKSHEWGYQLGSTYIRKVHFRDKGMIKQIEEKVVNRLRQVTSAIKQDGSNQVQVITSAAERKAAVAFAQASAIRPNLVGAALGEIGKDPDIAAALFEILEIERLGDGEASLLMVPPGNQLLWSQLLAAKQDPPPKASSLFG